MLWQVDVSALEKEDAELAERYRKLAKKYDTKFKYAAREMSNAPIVGQDLASYDWATKHALEGRRRYVKSEDARFQGKKNGQTRIPRRVNSQRVNLTPNRAVAAPRLSMEHNISRLPEDVKDSFADFFDRL